MDEDKNILIGEMPLYQSHKQVRALKIVDLEDDGHGSVTMLLEGDRRRVASEGLFARYTPKPGDYYVVYADGYESISPAAAFEEGYTLVAPAGDPG